MTLSRMGIKKLWLTFFFFLKDFSGGPVVKNPPFNIGSAGPLVRRSKDPTCHKAIMRSPLPPSAARKTQHSQKKKRKDLHLKLGDRQSSWRINETDPPTGYNLDETEHDGEQKQEVPRVSMIWYYLYIVLYMFIKHTK